MVFQCRRRIRNLGLFSCNDGPDLGPSDHQGAVSVPILSCVFLPSLLDLPSQRILPKAFRPVVRKFERHLNAPYHDMLLSRADDYCNVPVQYMDLSRLIVEKRQVEVYEICTFLKHRFLQSQPRRRAVAASRSHQTLVPPQLAFLSSGIQRSILRMNRRNMLWSLWWSHRSRISND